MRFFEREAEAAGASKHGNRTGWARVAGAAAVATIAATVTAAGCGGMVGRPPEEDFGPALTQVLRWQQAPASEVVQCHTFKLENDAPVDVKRIQFQLGTGSHHVHIYRSDMPEPDGVTDCTGGISWPRWQLMVGAQTKPLDWRLPEGLTVPLAPHQQILVQVHWLNVTTAPVEPEITLRFALSDHAGTPVGTLFGINKRVAIAPGERLVMSQRCPLPEGANLLAMMGHFHALGRRYEVTMGKVGSAGVPETIYSGADEGTLELTTFDPPRAAPASSELAFTCELLNNRMVPARWGPDTTRDEHCNMVAYYYPAVADSAVNTCVTDFAQTGSASALTAWSGEITPGTASKIEVRLAAPAPADTLVELSVSDPSVLDLPPFAVVRTGADRLEVPARALRPARGVKIMAEMGGPAAVTNQARAVATVAVGGLVLSEVMPPSGSGSGPSAGGWVEIANLGTVPFDLGRYTLALGGATFDGRPYDLSGPALTGTIDPLGCVVLPVALGPGVADGDGVALAEIARPEGSEPVPPLDALVYGARNTHVLVDRTGAVAAAIATPPSGQSLARRTQSSWSTQTVPTPGICEVR